MTSHSNDMIVAPMRQVVNPVTGELIDFDADNHELASKHSDIRMVEVMLREAREEIGREFIRRMDHDAKYTIHADGYKITAPSPAPGIEYDTDELAAVLVDLVSAGVVSEDAARRALKEEVRLIPQTAGIKALLKLGGEVAEKIRTCGREVDKPRRVRITEDQ